ncbi:MAG: Fic family protein [Candidatus Aureabacteria bacterium]|nr:Fic family protein [Candidatus Auribacterota bacterium]
MKLLEKAPSLDILKGIVSNLDSFIKLYRLPELQSLVNKANKEYAYWDRFKYWPMPAGVTPEQAWILLKIARRSAIKSLPVQDLNGKYFTYWQPEEALKYLHLIDRDASGQLLIDEPGIDSASKGTYIVSSLMEEAIASSQLEGAATTRRIAKEMLKSGRKPRDKAEQMIINNYKTICKVQELSKNKLSIDLLQQIHTLITENTLDDSNASGRFRRDTEPVEVIDESTGEVLFTPPPAHLLKDRIQALCDYANCDAEQEFIHPVIKAIVLHFWLAYEHPFIDGNGRAARAVFYWYLLSRNYWLVQYLAISKTILRDPSQYKKSFLYSEQDESDLTYFIMYNLRAIRLSIVEVSNYLARRQKEIRKLTSLIRSIPNLNYRQYSLLQHALKHPDAIYRFKSHMNTHSISYQTARTDILELSELNFLEKILTKNILTFSPPAGLFEKIQQYTGKPTNTIR